MLAHPHPLLALPGHRRHSFQLAQFWQGDAGASPPGARTLAPGALTHNFSALTVVMFDHSLRGVPGLQWLFFPWIFIATGIETCVS